MDRNGVFFVEAVGDKAAIEDGFVRVDKFNGIFLLREPDNCTGFFMIDLYFPHLALILEESHEFVYFVVVFRDVFHVYAVFSLPFLPSWLLSVSVIILRRRSSVWFGHLMDDGRLRDRIIHGFAF